MERTFRTGRARVVGNQVHSTFTITGGELDLSVVSDLTDVTLESKGNGNYVLTVTGETEHARTVRNLTVFQALRQLFMEDNRRPLNQLIADDRASEA